MEVLTRGKSRLRASNAHVGIVAHITPEEFAKHMRGKDTTDTANGFTNRFLYCLAKRSKVLPTLDMEEMSTFARMRDQAAAVKAYHKRLSKGRR